MASKRPNQTIGEEEEVEKLPPLSPISELLATSPMSLAVNVVFELETPVDDHNKIFQFLRTKFVPFNIRLSSVIHIDEKGVLRWKKVNVTVEDHVIIPQFPTNLSPIQYEEHFQEYLSRLATKQFQEGRPLWEFHLIKYPTQNGSMALVFRFNHVLGDGYSFMNLVFSIFERADDPSLPLALPALSLKHNEGKGGYLGFVSKCVNTVWDIGWTMLKPSVLSDHPSMIRSVTPRVEFEPITVSSISIPLEHVKQIKIKVQGTVNDVITGLLYYAIHLYKLRMSHISSEGTCMTSMVMFNTRPLEGYKTIDEMLKANVWGNRASFLQVPIPSFTRMDETGPLDFIAEAKRYNKRMKDSFLIFLTYPIIKMLKSIKGVKGVAEFVHSSLKSTSTMITNMIGPNVKVAMAGHPINNFYFIVTGIPQSLVFTIVSYMGEVKVVATMEKKFIDSQLFVSCMKEAFKRMFEEICGQDLKCYK